MNRRNYIVVISFLWLLLGGGPETQAQPADDNPFAKAEAAWARRDYPAYVQLMQRIIASVGKHPGLQLNVARAYSLLGDTTQALQILAELAGRHLPYPVYADTAFARLRPQVSFQRLAGQFRQNSVPLLRSQAGFVIRDRALIPEGVAYDPVSQRFFVGSLAQRKIVQVNAREIASNFTKSGQDSLTAVLGLKVDPVRRILWACSADEQTGKSALYKYSLKTGQLLQRYVPDAKLGPHLLNDLTFDLNGKLYVTDSRAGRIYTLEPEGDSLRVLHPGFSFIYPNGIALSDDFQRLYVADFTGITLIQLSTLEQTRLTAPPDIPLYGLDGLYFYQGYLVGVQNGIGADRIVQLGLGSDGKEVKTLQVLESNHPQFKIPTTGVIVGNELYYIANSQLRNLAPDGTLQSPQQLKEVTVLKVKLTSPPGSGNRRN